MSRSLSTQENGTMPTGSARTWLGLIAAGAVLAAPAAVTLAQAEDGPTPLDHREDAVTQVVTEEGAIPPGYGVKTVNDGETPTSIADELAADGKHKEVMDAVENQLGSPKAGDKLLLELSDTNVEPVVSEQPIAYYVPQQEGAAPLTGMIEVPIIDGYQESPK